MLTLKDYKSFKKICNIKEWADDEPRLLEALEKTWDVGRSEIHISRKEYDRAITLLTKTRYPDTTYGGSEILKIAIKLEEKYPEEILSFYMSGLGNPI